MKNCTSLLLVGLLSLFFINCSNSQTQSSTSMAAVSPNQFEQLFVQTYTTYTMDIAAAGIATLPAASLAATGELIVDYQYTSGGENRTGKMILQEKKKHYFEGNWKTTADNGNSYAGTLYFVFKEDGTAKGYYQFGGSDYTIIIDKKQ